MTITEKEQLAGTISPYKRDDQKKEEYEAVKLQVKRLLFGVSCLDCAMKRKRESK